MINCTAETERILYPAEQAMTTSKVVQAMILTSSVRAMAMTPFMRTI